MALGAKAPAFALPDTVSGATLALDQIKGAQATVIMFICNHCPYVQHVNAELVRIGRDYGPRGVGFAAISANDARSYPQDGPDAMRQAARELGYPFPYLYDESQAVARSYHAACTPDFYLFDRELRCVYRGQLDDSRPHSGKPVTGADLRAALDATLSGRAVSPQQTPSVGCGIKWRG